MLRQTGKARADDNAPRCASRSERIPIMNAQIFMIACCIYGMTALISILEKSTVITMRRDAKAVVYWVEKFAAIAVMISGIACVM